MNMLENKAFAEVMRSIGTAPTLPELGQRMENLKEAYGLCHMVYLATRLPGLASPNPTVLTTYRPDWVSYYRKRDFVSIDPVVRACRRGFLPVDWGTLQRADVSTRTFFGEANEFGVGRQGLSFPIRGSRGDRAVCIILN